ncbi:MAG: D-alanyl-D-alanine carboxypeptidase [Clostridia bacterium]|nr:D-alanyl-D-alanine carboxypeptidase [Clostridia bacterium]
MKKIITYVLVAVLSLVFSAAPIFAGGSDIPVIVAEGAILIDAKTGTVLYSKNSDAQFEPASTTKMMTCILALENLDLDEVVVIDAETPFTEGSRVYLEEGERITVNQLLHALMLESANDAAVALAKRISGTTEDFAKLMNEKAKEIGATNTNFVNPNGLHIEGHLTTPHDLAMIAKYAMQNKTFRELVTTYKYDIPATNMKEERHLYNTNRLLYDEKTKVDVNGIQRTAKYEGVTGIKTGYTSHAGGCLVSGAERNGTELIAVVLKSTDKDRFGDSIALLDYGFANYYSAHPVAKGDVVTTAEVSRGKVKEIDVKAAEDVYITLPAEASADMLSTEAKLNEDIVAPLKKGDKIGTLEVKHEGDLVAEVPLVAAQSVESGSLLALLGMDDLQVKKFYITFAVIFVIIINIFFIYLALKRRGIRRRKALRQQRAMEIVMERRRRESEQRRWPY